MDKIIAFAGATRVAFGDVSSVVRKIKSRMGRRRDEPLLIFDVVSSQPVEIDFRGSVVEILSRIKSQIAEPKVEARSVGRPKLGVVSKEVTLLPRHWDWLNSQPGGASVVLRRLVEGARKANVPNDRKREAQESAYRFMTAMAGNQTGYEDALRALYAGDAIGFQESVRSWPRDVQQHALALAQVAM